MQNKGRSRDEQYEWLEERRDKGSTLEREFLKTLYDTARRLPESRTVPANNGCTRRGHFYYDRDSVPGVCVFCDGPEHMNRDGKPRTKTREQHYKIWAIE